MYFYFAFLTNECSLIAYFSNCQVFGSIGWLFNSYVSVFSSYFALENINRTTDALPLTKFARMLH